MAAYTAAGLVTSSLVGATLGVLGLLVVPPGWSRPALLVTTIAAILGVVRQVGWAAPLLPRVKRQTSDFWAKRFPTTLAATLWGLDLGLTFSARWTFSGLSLFTLVAVLGGQPVFGAALFGALWLGRASSVWVAPMLLRDSGDVTWLLDVIGTQYGQLRRLNMAGLSWSAAMILLGWSWRALR